MKQCLEYKHRSSKISTSDGDAEVIHVSSSGELMSSNYPGEYNDHENMKVVLVAENPRARFIINLTSFSTEACCDNFKVQIKEFLEHMEKVLAHLPRFCL